MSYVNNYKVMDVFNAIDDHTGEMIIPARIFVSSSFDGGEPDYGQCQQRVINTEELSYVYHIPDPRMEWPSVEGFGVHNNAGELGYVISGTYEISYPDGTTVQLAPGSFFINEKGQPYRFVVTDDEIGSSYAVFYGTKAQKIGNEPSSEKGTGYKTGSVDELEGKEIAKGVSVRTIGTADGVTLLYVELAKGAILPFDGWTQLKVAEIITVLSGSIAGIYPDRTYTVGEKHAFYNEAQQPHKLINTGDEKVALLVALKSDSLEQAGIETTQTKDFV